MFEPRLDQNVSVDILLELENQGIGRIIAFSAEQAGTGICTYDSRDDDQVGYKEWR